VDYDCIRQHVLSRKHQLQIRSTAIVELEAYRLTHCLASDCEHDAPQGVHDLVVPHVHLSLDGLDARQ
jgi:hypothetical protein